MIRNIIAIVAWFLLFGLAATYGGVWHSQNYPTENVQVQLLGGTAESGTLRRAWDRDWVLTKSDGAEVRFSDVSNVVMVFESPNKNLSYWQQWRAWGPVVLVSIGVLLVVFWSSLRRLAK